MQIRLLAQSKQSYFTYNPVFGVVYTCIPSEGSKHSSNDCYTEMEQELISLSYGNQHVWLFGDFNARTGNVDNYFTPDNYLLNITNNADSFQLDVKTHYSVFEKLQVSSARSDIVVNNFGYKLVEFCTNNVLYVVNSRVESDKFIDNTTCRGVSTINYV